jgi:hypothetical protein
VTGEQRKEEKKCKARSKGVKEDGSRGVKNNEKGSTFLRPG